jgi:hypothetical protein
MATEYQEEHDLERLAALKPYRAERGAMTREQVATMVNTNFYIAYGPDFAEKTAAHITIDPIWYYEDLLKKLLSVPNLRFETIRDSLASPPTGADIICTVRHDVDGDLIAARLEAELENSLGISTSYYLLHTAPYYSIQRGDVLFRNEVSAKDYLFIQSLGHELALHTDGMTLYQSHNIDGAAAIRDELAWLRSVGCDIRGTTAHNSFGVYGCNNYSVFKNRPLGMSTPAGPKGVLHNGKWAPLQILDEAELGLEYEANDLFWQDSVPLLYGCLMTQNNWYIAENQYGLLSPATKSSRPPLKFRYGTHNDLLDAVAALKGPAYVKLVVHPMHYGLRFGASNAPWHADLPTDERRGAARIWAGGGSAGTVASCAITLENEFGTPDRGLKSYETGDFRIAVLGGSQIQTHTVSADSKYSQVAARLVRGPIRKHYATAASFAALGASGQQLRDALSQMTAVASPDVIVIAIGETGSEERVALANELYAAQRAIICILEGDAATQEISESRATELQAGLSCPLINPFPAILAYVGSAIKFWHNSGVWAPQAHAIVGKLLAESIIEQQKKATAHATLQTPA